MNRRRLGGTLAALAIAALTLVLGAAPATAAPFHAAFVPGTSPFPAWYQANGSTIDRNGNGPALAWTGGASYGPGGFGEVSSFHFDGTNGLTGGTDLGNLGTDAFYLSFDLKTTASAGQYELVSKRTTCPSSAPFLDITMHRNGIVEVQYFGSASNNNVASSTQAVNDGTWHTIAVKQYDSHLTLRIDGQQQDSIYMPTIPNITNSGPFVVGNGNSCTVLGHHQPLIGDMDNLFLTDLTQGGRAPVDLSARQVSVPTVAAGTGGSFPISMYNPAPSAQASTFRLAPPTGVTFTGVSGDQGQCAVRSGAVVCPPSGLGTTAAGTTTITVEFTTSADAAPDSTLTTTSDALVNQTEADPNHTNDTGFPVSVHIAPVNSGPLADLWLVGGVAGLLVLLGGGWALRRRGFGRA